MVDDTGDRDERAAARERLTRRYGTGDGTAQPRFVWLSTYAAVGEALSVPGPDRASVTPADIDDALALTGDARLMLDRIELYLIGHARAQGRTWEQIAVLRGYADRRRAQQRFQRLRERWPGYEPVSGRGSDE